MWVRKNLDGKMYMGALPSFEAVDVDVSATAISAPVRCWGARSVQFLLKASAGAGTLAIWVSHVESPSSIVVLSASTGDWVVGGTSQGVTVQTASTALTPGGGQLISVSPVGSSGGLITAKWARLVIATVATKYVGVTCDAAVIYDGDDCPKVKVGRGYTTKNGVATIDGSNL